MVVTEIKCDRCNERISEGRPYHKIQWRDVTPGTELGDFLVADLCDGCYDTIVKQDLAQYSYKSILDLSLFN
jgi:hypothetical protein